MPPRHHGTVLLQLVQRVAVQRLHGIHHKPFSYGEFPEKTDGLVVKLHVGRLGAVVVQEQNLETGTAGSIIGFPVSSPVYGLPAQEARKNASNTANPVLFISFIIFVTKTMNRNQKTASFFRMFIPELLLFL